MKEKEEARLILLKEEEKELKLLKESFAVIE